MATPDQFAAELAPLRRDMLRFARMQLRDDAAAEDAVQEAFIAAVEKRDSFGGRASLKTWVFAILRNKIIDMLRARNSGIQFVSQATHQQMRISNEDDHWTEESWPSAWGDPEQSLEAQQFWAVFEACLERLAGSSGTRLHAARDDGLRNRRKSAPPCKISTSNCGVLLHRARIALRACLEHSVVFACG